MQRPRSQPNAMGRTQRRAFVASLALLTCLVPSWAQAKAPPGRYVVTAVTVQDTWTKLTWQRNMDAPTYAWSATSAAGSAQAYCTGLSLSGTGWRLPSITELLTIVDRAESPTVDPVAFPNTPAVAELSTSAVVGASGNAWGVKFDSGISTLLYSLGGAPTARVRCVR